MSFKIRKVSLKIKMVLQAGIEPATPGFSVLCSTNWATEAFKQKNGGPDGTWTRDLLRDRQAC